MTAGRGPLPSPEAGDPEEQLQACREAALRFLAPRPRSSAEVQRRLTRRGFAPGIITATLRWLEERGYLDDAAFAAFWAENRSQFRPRGQRLLRQELLQRGIAPELAQRASVSVDEEESAYRAAQRWARRLAGSDAITFRRRLGAFLFRRGFAAEVVERTVEQIWRETTVA